MPTVDLKAAAEAIVPVLVAVIGIIWALYQKALNDIKIMQTREVERSETIQSDCKACMTKFVTQNADVAKAAITGLEQNSAALIALKNDLHLYETLTKLGKKKAEGAV